MTTKCFRFLRGLYEPLLVLLVVGAAGLLLYALYHALSGGRGDSIYFDAAFDDVSGIKVAPACSSRDARGQCGCHEI
jgi:hypothetical protein